MTQRIAIIGAGASGITMGKTLSKSGRAFEIIEKTSDFGGNWQPEGPASKMYSSVHLISSKTNTQFSDHPMPADYPPYPRHGQFWRYLKSVAEKHRLAEHARFDTEVLAMRPIGNQADANLGWRLSFGDGSEADYSDVIVCNGLLRKPREVSYPGHFDGPTLHSAEYRGPEIFRGRRVLVVGAGNSGCDIAVDAAQNASACFHSTRRGYHYLPKFLDGKPTQEWLMNEASRFDDAKAYWNHVKSVIRLAGYDGTAFGLPEPDHDIDQAHPIMNSLLLYHIGHGDIAPRPDVATLEGDHVRFTDGSREAVDVIVYATGFNVHIPFLDPSLVDWSRGLSSIFLHMVPPRFDNLLFFGYLNAPSGYGNVANTTARFVDAYFRARETGGVAWEVLQRMKHRWGELDLGQARYMKTERHTHEFDLWKYISTVNFLATKLAA